MPGVEKLRYAKYRFLHLAKQPGKAMRLAARPALMAYNHYLRPAQYAALADPDEVIFVDTSAITYIWGDKQQRSLFPPGSIIRKYPDLEAFSSHCRRDPKNRSVRLHFTEGVPWIDTELFAYYRRVQKRAARYPRLPQRR